MTEKFPSLDDAKQRAFSLDVACFGARGDRAAVAVGERGRLSFFFSRADGTWGVSTRAHDDLSQRPRRPSNAALLGWTRRTGIAAAGDQVAFVYKRRFGRSDSRDLYVDPFEVDPARGDLRGGTAPRRVPRQALGIDRFGFSVWAGVFNDRLLVVTQVFRAGVAPAPRLVLLEAAWPVIDPAVLEAASAWTVTDLGSGGWDLDARREGATLAVLHRRRPEAFFAGIGALDPGFAADVTVPLADSADVPRPLSQMAVLSLTLVQVDLTSTTVTAVDPDLGVVGENPQIHQLTPFIATVDRLVRGTLVVRSGQVRLQRFESERHLVMRTSRGWRTAPLLTQPLRWPSTLDDFARVHQAIAVDPIPAPAGTALGLTWTSLWTPRPTVLFEREATDKGMLLTFGHQDPQLGALRATTFRVFEDNNGNTLRADAESFTLLDLGHRHVPGPRGPDEPEPVEHQQLRPRVIVENAHHAEVPDDALEIVREEHSGNTMTGDLVAVAERPASGYAYTEMGDGGVRVVFEAGLDLPPPTATTDEKEFRPGWVAEPPRPGRAWVRLAAQEFVATRLPAYFASPPQAASQRSLACRRQQDLDVLATAVDLLRTTRGTPTADPLAFVSPAGSGGRVHYREAPSGTSPELLDSMILTDDAAEIVQDQVGALVPARPAASDRTQPFRIEIHRRQGLVFAGDPVAFSVVVPDDPAAPRGYQFDWEFSDGSADTGPNVEHAFSATRPDFSGPTPGDAAPNHVVRVTVTSPDGRVSTAATSLAVPASLWAMVWEGYEAFRQPPDNILPGIFARDVTVSFFRYSVRYQVDEQGRGAGVEVRNGLENHGRFRFLGNAQGQGDTEYEVPVRVVLDGVRLTGDVGRGLGALVEIKRVDAMLRCLQRFTIGVQTSDRRDASVESQTIQQQAEQRGQPPTMIPSSLSALPIGGLAHTVDDKPVVDSQLTGAGWTLGVLVPALISTVGSAAVFVILAPLLIVLVPGLVAATLVSVGIALLVGAGLGLLATLLLNNFVVKPLIAATILDRLKGPEVRAGLFRAGFVTYAGEGLAEAITIQLICQAQDDGHPVADPANDGRDRFRSPLVETIVVSEGACKAQLRV